MAVISVSDALLTFLNNKRVYFSPFGNDKVSGRFRAGENLHFTSDVRIEPYSCYINRTKIAKIGVKSCILQQCDLFENNVSQNNHLFVFAYSHQSGRHCRWLGAYQQFELGIQKAVMVQHCAA
jgi:hypothetical protein